MTRVVFDGDDGIHPVNACGHWTQPGDTADTCTTCDRLVDEEDAREEARYAAMREAGL